MNSGQTAERVYDAIKRRLMAHEVRPGDRLDPAMLAESLSSSVTPVRDALHMLAGEGLVEARTSGGFHVPSIDEPALKDLYGWAEEVAILSLRAWPRDKSPTAARADAVLQGASADWTAAVFGTIGARSDNAEHDRATQLINDRLHAVRTVEPSVIPDVRPELQALTIAAARDDRAALRRLIGAHYRKRRRVASDIVRSLYRAR